ncbi:MAG: hypothetical protein JO332_12600, partial [Planctomycetaceae bacterium]|nr:hypothetical protein [Planctomycetaceae bacterium]
TITVTATDTSGNTSTDTVDVTLDIAAPTVAISTPTSGATWVVQGATVTIGGTTTDNVGLQSVAVTNSAVPGTTSADISTGLPGWTIANVPLALGANILTVTSTDKAGNTATAVLTVTRDGTKPGVAITQPTSAATYYTNVPSVSLGGTASDNVGLQKVDWSNALTTDTGTAVGTSVWAASIPLALGDNDITVTSTDTSGRVSDPVQITVKLDTTPPVIAVTAPALNTAPNPPTYTTNLGPVAFGGTVTDTGGVNTVTWANAATGGSGSATVDTVPATPTWTASVPVTSGLNTIVFTATDRAGNPQTTTVNVTFDAVAPTVTITGPTAQPNYITKAATVQLDGTASDNVGIQSIAWANAALSGPGSSGSAGSTSPWTVPSITLAPGDNAITVTVTDTAGNTNTDVIVVRQDVNLPTVAFATPVASGTYRTNQSNVAVSGTAADDVAVQGVTVNGVAATGTTSWTGSVTLAAGSNTITAVATDSAGNTQSTAITIILDTTDPLMAITGHNDGDTFSTVTGTVTLAGTASDPAGGTVQTVSWANTTTGGSGTAIFGGGTWSTPIALTPGTNLIVITTRDAAGNITQETLTIIHDTQAPTVSISSPTASATYNTNTGAVPPVVLLGGTASDNVNVFQVTWSNSATGGSGTATGTTAWSASVPLVEGSNQITVVATDDVGNSSSDTITVTFDPTLPVINITSPTPSATYSTTVTPLDFAGNASDNLSLASVTWNNLTALAVGTASGTTSWTASGVPLVSGPNTIRFTATDGVGNTQNATIVVTYDVTPPVVAILSPAGAISTQTRPLAISGTASDNVGVQNVTWSNSLTGTTGTATFTAGLNVNWSASIPMIPGVNTITIRATDPLGNIGTSSVDVTYSHETVVPTMSVDTPATSPFVSPTQLIALAGKANDNVGVTQVSWLNRTTGVFGTASLALPDWTAEVPLANGDNLIDITVSDDVGNTVTTTITVTFVATVELNPPTVTITAPTTSDTFTTTTSPLHLEANSIDDVGVVNVHWTNQGTFGDGESGWGTFWYADIPLVAGPNLITVTAIDTSGNVGTDTITVTYNPPVGDPVPPSVSIVTPLASGTVNVSVPVVDISGTAADNNNVDAVTYSNTATGVYATASGTTNWTATNVALNAGVNVITARAVDPAGNLGQSTLVVVYTPPVAAKPVAPVIPAGMCGCTGAEALLLLGACWLRRRLRKSAR